MLGLAAAATGQAGSTMAVLAGGATTVIYAAFAGYLTTVLRRRGNVPCGCLGGDEPVHAAAIARAAAFATAAAAFTAAAAADRGGAIASALAPWPARAGVLAGAVLVAGLAVQLVSLASALGSHRGPTPGRPQQPRRRPAEHI